MSDPQQAAAAGLQSLLDVAAHPPRFFFQVDCMRASGEFRQRANGEGQWQPPRPLHSNVLVHQHTTGQWYHYDNGHTQRMPNFDARDKTHYKTFSFYMDNELIWIYKHDATTNKVGDGTGNPVIRRSTSRESGEEEVDESSSESDGPQLDDWQPLTFCWDYPDMASKATTRASNNTLQTQREDQAWVFEVLPTRYHAFQEAHTLNVGYGGLVGDLPTLIALLAYSVAPHQVDNALLHCLGRTYNPHGQGEGWTAVQRGLVIRTMTLHDTAEAGQAGELQNSPAARSVQHFESGHFPGYGKFFA